MYLKDFCSFNSYKQKKKCQENHYFTNLESTFKKIINGIKHKTNICIIVNGQPREQAELTVLVYTKGRTHENVSGKLDVHGDKENYPAWQF